MLLWAKFGQGSVIIRVKLLDSAVSTGAGKTGLSSSSSGLIVSTIADSEATATAYTQAGSTIESITTLGTFAAPTATKCRFKEVDATNHKGVYELQFADARFAISGAKSLLISISGVSGIAECDAVIPLPTVDLFDSVRAGLTSLPNAAAEAAGGLYTRGTGPGQIRQDSNGRIDANAKAWIDGTIPAVNVTGVPKVDLTDIDGQATSGNNATLNLKKLNIVNSAGDAIVASATGSNGAGIKASGNGTGAGLEADGGATGPGIYGKGGATGSTDGVADGAGAGMYLEGHSTTGKYGHGLHATAIQGVNGNGIYSQGDGDGDGIGAIGSQTLTGGSGFFGEGGVNGNGMGLEGVGTGAGLVATGSGTGVGIGANGGAGAPGVNVTVLSGDGAAILATGSGAGAGLAVQGGPTGNGFTALGGASGNGAQFTGGATDGAGLEIDALAAGRGALELYGDPDVLCGNSGTLQGDLDGRILGDVIVATVNDASPAANDFNGAATLSSSDDFYNGSVLNFTGGALKGISRKISNYVGATRTIQFTGSTGATDEPFPTSPANGDAFEILGRID